MLLDDNVFIMGEEVAQYNVSSSLLASYQLERLIIYTGSLQVTSCRYSRDFRSCSCAGSPRACSINLARSESSTCVVLLYIFSDDLKPPTDAHHASLAARIR